MGLPSLATAALIGWEWLQREEDIFATFDVRHYRPKERPDTVRVMHEKTNEENWVPLFDENGVPLYPELMAELDAIKRDRIGGLMLCRDWGDRCPWPTWPKPDRSISQRAARSRGSFAPLACATSCRSPVVPAWRLHRGGRCRSDRCRDQGAGSAQVGEGAAALRQAHHEADGIRYQEAAGDSGGERELTVKICQNARSPLVRMTK